MDAFIRPNGDLDLKRVRSCELMLKVCWSCSRMAARAFDTCPVCGADQPTFFWFNSGARPSDLCVGHACSPSPMEGAEELDCAEEDFKYQLNLTAELIHAKLAAVPPEDWKLI
jgi:hypothetical protein